MTLVCDLIYLPKAVRISIFYYKKKYTKTITADWKPFGSLKETGDFV